MTTPRNKAELIDFIAEEAGISKGAATKALAATLSGVVSAMLAGPFSLVGFGTFSVKPRAAREGRNPKTGEPIKIPAANVPAFKAGKGLKDAVNSGSVLQVAEVD